MKTLKRIIFICLMVFQTGCLYLNTKTPLDTDVSTTQLGSKQGVSTVHSILWLVSWGDGSTAAAAKNGGITSINLLDSHIYMILFGLYTKVDTIAYGD